MKQEFTQPTGQAVQAKTAHIADQSSAANTGDVTGNVAGHDFTQINNFHHAEGDEPLDDDRKQQLSRRAGILETKYGLPKWKSRREVIEILGVISQDVMRAKHFLRANKVYDLLFEIEEHKAKAAEGGDKVVDLRNSDQLNAVITSLKERIADLTEELDQVKADHRTPSPVPVKQRGLRHRLLFAAVAAVFVLVGLGYVYKIQHANSSPLNVSAASPLVTATDSPSAAGTCQGRTKPYPIGSTVHNDKGGLSECVAGDAGKPPKWRAAR
ncbi:hypothetical protein [Paraburkholderia sp.]|uniref:hypothetical protein n=1 Tax=Paraburkholderia sp. TaxID=1926495 RepID=UPI003D6FAB30